MRRLRPSDYVTTAWKNGAGSTTQLAVHPAGASLAHGFTWRISIAYVTSDGPFSTFPGLDRHLVVVEGEGMRLALTVSELVLAPFVPVAFSGDEPAFGTLVRGPVRDFNLMVDRARARGALACHEVTEPTRVDVPEGETCVMHVVRGALDLAEEGDTLVAQATFGVAPRGPARVVVARVTVRG